MTEVLTNRAQTTLAAAILSSDTVITRPSAATGFPGDSNGPLSGNFRVVVTDGTNYELMLVTAGQGTTSLTVTREVELIGGVQTAFGFAAGSTITPVSTAAALRSGFGLYSGIPAPAAPTVTIVGTAGTTTYDYSIVATTSIGSTTSSATGSTTTGNAVLSPTDYNLVSWPAVPLPAGSPGNLVYDSNLTNAIASVGATWFGRTGDSPGTGTADGDFNVLNPGADSAEWVYYGTGASQSSGMISNAIAVVPGTTYTLSALFDAISVTSGQMYLYLVDQVNPTTTYASIVATNGAQSAVSGTWVAPSGVTEVRVDVQTNSLIVTAGATVSWSQIQLTETSTVQPYAPGPLWTYPVYRNGAQIGSTTALAFEDTGQAGGAAPPTIDTSGNSYTAVVGTNALTNFAGSGPPTAPFGFDVTGGHLNADPTTPALPANPLVSGTIYQNTTGGPITITLGVAATVAGTAQWALGASATPGTWGPATTTVISSTVDKTLTIPNGWYFSLTVTGTATIGTASVLGS